MKISILVPSRGRSKLLKNMCKKCLFLANHPEDIEHIIYIDEDDSETISMYNEMKDDIKYGNQIKAIIGKKQAKIAQYYNECYKISSADIIGVMADDCEFMTEGWDDMVMESFSKVEDKILLVYGDDGHQNGRMATTWFIHKKWVDTVGYANPPFFICAEGDRWVTYLAKKIKRLCYLPELKIIHRHKETEGDATNYIRIKYRKKMLKIYEMLKERRIDDSRKLKDYIKRFKDE